MLNDRNAVEAVAEAVYSSIYKGMWDDATQSAKDDARLDARTIISAYVCRQNALDAAKRLATWYYVDRKKPHVLWKRANPSVKAVMRRKAKAGFEAILEYVRT